MKRVLLPLGLLLITCNACASQSAAQRLPTVQGAWVVVAPQEPTYWRGAEHKLYEYQQRIAQLIVKRNPVADAQTLIDRGQYYLLTSRHSEGGIYGLGRGYGSVLPTAGVGIDRVLQNCPAKILQGRIPLDDIPSTGRYGARFNQTMVKACIKRFRLNESFK
ncbi:hypothetical protein [Thiothrix eikelboomii]|uniref:hypothetical protein n=1 Tax=Thiothrix eikelboomii TaxID=92487 RepID=UPI003BAF7B58